MVTVKLGTAANTEYSPSSEELLQQTHLGRTSAESLAIALNRIMVVKKSRGKALDLSGLSLTELPEEFGRLRSLTSLNIDGNFLNSFPAAITRFSALQNLSLVGNPLVSLPPEIGRLTELRMLNASETLLEVLPREFGQLKKLTSLHLRENRFTTLPSPIFDLESLTLLDVQSCNITSIHPKISALRNLTKLWLNNNNIRVLPSTLFSLHKLIQLLMWNNRISVVPPQIGQLSSLQVLDASQNLITSLPSEISRLTSLASLTLQHNMLRSLPREIGGLTELKFLDVRNNHLKALPASLRELPKLERLFLHGNPSLKLSPTVLGPNPEESDAVSATAKSILDFFFGRAVGRTRPLNEVKLILVGRGGAGKTSAVRAMRDQPFREDEDSTPGIALCDWTMNGCKGQPVTAHVWDFAGQVITHALHQFFFSVRSVYVLVLTGRENNEREDAEYWLRLIKAFGTDDQGNGPPVIIALNKWDVPGCRPRLDRGALQERYPFVSSFVEMDCKSGKGIQKLKAALCREVDRLKWVREPFPATWDAIRVALTKGGKKRAHLTYVEYRELCARYGEVNEGMQDSLAEILHNLGTAINYRNDPRLREATVLQPEWLTKNVYSLMRRAEKQAGVLKQSDVQLVLKRISDPEMQEYLVRIMERFEIAYSRVSSGVWLIPQALPDVQDKGALDFATATKATRLRYTYQALPEGLVARAIVRLHEFIEEVNGTKRQWGSGAILTRKGARALVRTEPQDRQVMITVTGPSKARQQLAGLCQAELRDIHREIRGLDPVEETEVQGTWVATATLEADEQKGQPTGIPTPDQGTVLVDPAVSNNEYSVWPARSDEMWKPTAFVSYSKSNVSQRKRLESELKILKNEGLLAKVWHDRMIDPGDVWDDTIQNQLLEADVFILLASVEALSTDYITKHEIPQAMELHTAGRTVVVPVILEKCRWDKTPLGVLNALPDKARPLSTWNPHSNGWYSISEGLAKVLKKLIDKTKKSSIVSAANPSKTKKQT